MTLCGSSGVPPPPSSKPTAPKSPELHVANRLEMAADRQKLGGPSVLGSSVPATKPLPRAWARKSSAFITPAEPQDSYKSNGFINLDEAEADVIKSAYENALVGRLIGRNLRFEWVAVQLHERWGVSMAFG